MSYGFDEATVRRIAARKGYRLKKSRRTVDRGSYALIDPATNTYAFGTHEGMHVATLDQVADYLMLGDRPCIACYAEDVPTAFAAVVTSPTDLIGAFVALDIPVDEARALVGECEPLRQLHHGQLAYVIRVCEACAASAGLRVAPLGDALPTYGCGIELVQK